MRDTAKEMGIAATWLNRDVSLVPGMPPRPDGDERTVYEGRCFPHSPYSEFPDVAKEYLIRELPGVLAERGTPQAGRGLAELGRKAREAARNPGPGRFR